MYSLSYGPPHRRINKEIIIIIIKITVCGALLKSVEKYQRFLCMYLIQFAQIDAN
jgi:hypothetical protein